MSSTLIKIKEFQEHFTQNEKKISEFLQNNAEEIMVLNTYDLALKCGVSQAAVVRFAKKLGFKGFPEFKISLANDLGNISKNEGIQIIYEEIKTTDALDLTGLKVINENMRAIEDTYKILNFKDMERAAAALNEADRIFLLGAGFSGIVARDFQYKLWELGKRAIFETDQHINISNAATVTEKDVVFVISYSGKTLDIHQALKRYKIKNPLIITLTKLVSNPIKDLGDINLNTVVEKSNFRSTSLSTRMAQMTVIDILYVKLMQMNEVSANEFIGEAFKNVEDMKI